MSSTSRGCQPKRSASSCAVSTSGETTLTQVSPLAVSSWTTGAGEMTGEPPRARERRMRGRLGMGTQWVVFRQRHVLDCSPGACLLKPRRERRCNGAMQALADREHDHDDDEDGERAVSG